MESKPKPAELSSSVAAATDRRTEMMVHPVDGCRLFTGAVIGKFAQGMKMSLAAQADGVRDPHYTGATSTVKTTKNAEDAIMLPTVYPRTMKCLCETVGYPADRYSAHMYKYIVEHALTKMPIIYPFVAQRAGAVQFSPEFVNAMLGDANGMIEVAGKFAEIEQVLCGRFGILNGLPRCFREAHSPHDPARDPPAFAAIPQFTPQMITDTLALGGIYLDRLAKAGNDYNAYIVGSAMVRAGMHRHEFELSDIDIAIPATADSASVLERLRLFFEEAGPLVAGGGAASDITFTTKNTRRFVAKSAKLGISFDVFIGGGNIAEIISMFHFDCVRAAINVCRPFTDVVALPSYVRCSATNKVDYLGPFYLRANCSAIVDKYRARGYTIEVDPEMIADLDRAAAAAAKKTPAAKKERADDDESEGDENEGDEDDGSEVHGDDA
jgi:hypothetical protein